MAGMAQVPHYSADRFPADLIASLRAAFLTAAICGPAIWYLSLRYMRHAYPHHPELEPAAVVAGVLDAALLGLGALVVTFAVRIWRYERVERKRSDTLLRLALDELQHGPRDDV